MTRVTRKYIQPTCHAKTQGYGLWEGLKIDLTSLSLLSRIEQSCLNRFSKIQSVLRQRVHFTTENERFFVMGGFYSKLNSCRVCKWKWRFFSSWKRSKRLFKISKVSLIQLCFLSQLVFTVVCARQAFFGQVSQEISSRSTMLLQ